jgi:hypothetical protein
MGVEFNTRRKVNLFIEGLDTTYDFAINRLQQHMMTWRHDDPNPPDALQIPALARTVEKIMQETGNQPTVRAMNKQTTPRPNYQKDHKPSTTPQRPYVDIQCKFCGRHGHKKSTCDKMAIWCLMQDAHKQIDEKFKARLIAQYMDNLKNRRSRRMNRIKTTVRQLYSEGQCEQAENLWDSSSYKVLQMTTATMSQHQPKTPDGLGRFSVQPQLNRNPPQTGTLTYATHYITRYSQKMFNLSLIYRLWK